MGVNWKDLMNYMREAISELVRNLQELIEETEMFIFVLYMVLWIVTAFGGDDKYIEAWIKLEEDKLKMLNRLLDKIMSEYEDIYGGMGFQDTIERYSDNFENSIYSQETWDFAEYIYEFDINDLDWEEKERLGDYITDDMLDAVGLKRGKGRR